MELAPRYGALDGLAKADRLRLLPARDRPRRGDARGRGEEHELRDAPGPRRPAARVEVERQGRGGGGPRPRTSASLRRRRGPAMQECRDGKTLLRWERVRGRPRRPSESRGAAGSRPARARGAVRGPQMAERSDDMSQPRHPEASRGARPDVSCGMHQHSTRRRRARRAARKAWIHLFVAARESMEGEHRQRPQRARQRRRHRREGLLDARRAPSRARRARREPSASRRRRAAPQRMRSTSSRQRPAVTQGARLAPLPVSRSLVEGSFVGVGDAPRASVSSRATTRTASSSSGSQARGRGPVCRDAFPRLAPRAEP